MIALVLAAALSSIAGDSAVPDPPAIIRKAESQQVLPLRSERTPNLFHQPDWCGALHDEVVRRIRTSAAGKHGIAQYAVLRSIDHCGVPAPIGYHPDYLLPGAADPAAKPAGAPPNRR